MRAPVDLEREQTVDPALHQAGHDRPHVAVTIGVPEINPMRPQFGADPFVTRHHDRVKKIRNVIVIGLIAYFIAFFVDQYYFLEKKWWFLRELV